MFVRENSFPVRPTRRTSLVAAYASASKLIIAFCRVNARRSPPPVGMRSRARRKGRYVTRHGGASPRKDTPPTYFFPYPAGGVNPVISGRPWWSTCRVGLASLRRVRARARGRCRRRLPMIRLVASLVPFSPFDAENSRTRFVRRRETIRARLWRLYAATVRRDATRRGALRRVSGYTRPHLTVESISFTFFSGRRRYSNDPKARRTGRAPRSRRRRTEFNVQNKLGRLFRIQATDPRDVLPFPKANTPYSFRNLPTALTYR